MARPEILLLIAILAEGLSCSFAQEGTAVSKPDLTFNGKELVIRYDLIHPVESSPFNVSLDVENSKGEPVVPGNITGDVGNNIYPGSGKSIDWDLASDGIPLTSVLFVQLVAEEMKSAPASVKDLQISRAGAFARSAAFPGWGLSKLHPGQKHWMKGVSFYGCLAGSALLYQRSYTNYTKYLDSDIREDRMNYYDTSVRQEQVSLVLVSSAAAIWVMDLVWTLIDTRHISGRHAENRGSAIRLSPSFEPITTSPMITCHYRF